MIYTWNGAEFEFITDVLGVAPLGASAGDGQYFPVDHDEYIRIPGRSLTDEGRYEIRIAEELREVAFLDEIRLIAVDHRPWWDRRGARPTPKISGMLAASLLLLPRLRHRSGRLLTQGHRRSRSRSPQSFSSSSRESASR